MWPFTKKKNHWEGVMLRNEVLYTISKLGLIPYWLDMQNGMKMAVGSKTPRILDKYNSDYFPK